MRPSMPFLSVLVLMSWLLVGVAIPSSKERTSPTLSFDSRETDARFRQSNDPWFKQGRQAIEAAKAIYPIIRPARNVILFIGDGMGISTQTAARIYEGQLRGRNGEENLLSFEKFPYTALSKTYNTNQQVPDSAGTATAYHAGVKTKAGVIGLNDKAIRGECASSKGNAVTTALELAEMIGMSTGVVTTARITDASAAAAYAHGPERNWESDKELPDEARRNGCIDFARQLVEFPYGDGIEVALGGGRHSFIPKEMADPEDKNSTGHRLDGRNLAEEWRSKYDNTGYVWNTRQFDAIDPTRVDHLLGLFDPSHMEYETDRHTDGAGEPSLAEMTRKAIQILSRNPKGFFLFVEGGRIDLAHHAGKARRALVETVAFHNAVQTAVDMTDENNTLIIVSADHSHTLTIAGYPTRGNPILGKVQGNDEHGRPENKDTLANDGMPYTTLSYANGPGAWSGKLRPDLSTVDTTHIDYQQQATVPTVDETHAGEDVAIMARGPMAHLVRGVVEDTYIFHLMDEAASLRIRAGFLAD